MNQIVVLAGGKATRLFPLTKTIPKSMIPINEIPFIHHQLTLFKKNGITDVVLCLGVLSEKIMEYVGDGSKFGISVKYSVEDPNNLLGTLGALKNAYHLLQEHFCLIYGDSYLEIDYQKIMNEFIQSGKLGLMTVYKNNNSFVSSNVNVHDNMVVIYDKSIQDDFEYVDYGLSIFKKTSLDFFPSGTNLDLNQLYQKLISIKQLAAYEVKERFYEIGSPDGIKDLESHLR